MTPRDEALARARDTINAQLAEHAATTGRRTPSLSEWALDAHLAEDARHVVLTIELPDGFIAVATIPLAAILRTVH